MIFIILKWNALIWACGVPPLLFQYFRLRPVLDLVGHPRVLDMQMVFLWPFALQNKHARAYLHTFVNGEGVPEEDTRSGKEVPQCSGAQTPSNNNVSIDPSPQQ